MAQIVVSPPTAAGARRLPLMWGLAVSVVLLLSGLIYAPGIGGQAIWDDTYLLDGSGIGNPANLAQCFTRPFLFHYFRPLTSATFYLEHALRGADPRIYHLTNITIHVLTTVVLIALMQAVFRSRRVALLAGLFFALQPVQVSAVAWIGGRTDSLCTLFLALFAWSLVRAVQSQGRRRTLLLGAATLAYTAALLTKEQAMAALLLVPLAFRCFGETDRQPSRGSAWRATVPFVLATFVFLGAWKALGAPPNHPVMYSLGEQLAVVGRTVTYYTLVLLAPTPRWIHTLSLGGIRQAGLWPVLAGYGIVGLALALLRHWLRSAPQAAWFLASILLLLLPVSNVVSVPTLAVAPYRAGAAGLGVAALLGWALAGYAGRRRGAGSRLPIWISRWRPVIACVVVAWYAMLAGWGVRQWQNELRISTTCVRYDPDTMFSQLELAVALIDTGQLDQAAGRLDEIVYRLTARPVPGNAGTDLTSRVNVHLDAGSDQKWVGELYGKIAQAWLQRGNRARALRPLLLGRAVDADNLYVNLALANYSYTGGDWQACIAYLRRALQTEPNLPEKRLAIGQILALHGRWQEAAEAFQNCIQRHPGYAPGYLQLARVRIHLHDRAGASVVLDAAVRQGLLNRDQVQISLNQMDTEAN